ncbi:glutathione S-transferase [Stipitochalara longipes BDJ]|nr:glutathione S-transferase [Stipitochalara longipes BDJ]
MANKITLYSLDGTPNCIKVTLALEELNLNYAVHKIDLRKNVQKEAWFLDINPNGRIPALKDGDLRIFESGAILLYLADKYDTDYKISYPHGTNEYYEMLSWVMFQMGGIGPMQGQANHFRLAAKVRSDYAIDRYMQETKRLYSVLEVRLATQQWLAGTKYTIADIASFAWVRNAELIELDLYAFPNVEKWVQRIEGREAAKKGVSLPPDIKSPQERREVFAAMRGRVDGLGNLDKC